MTWAPVALLTEVVSSPQLRHICTFTEVEHPLFGRFETITAPFQIDGADVRVRGPAPIPGQHNHEVLRHFGLDDEEIAQLAVAGVLG